VIEVNLLPGGKKGGGGGVAVLYMGWQFLGVRSEAKELNVQLETAVQDSINNAVIIARTNQLQARGDSIQERVAIIQEIDAGRYTWPHLLDEVAAAVPDFTWLREVIYQSDNPLTVRIAGRAGSIFAITSFMRRLEASRFIRAVNTETIQQQPSEENPEDLVYMFEVTMTYDPPGIDELETVPLFEDGTSQAQTAGPGN
jgi:Tfp pilus assembly protein PilN